MVFVDVAGPYAMNLLHVIGSMDPRGGGPCQGIRNLAGCASQRRDTRVEVVCLDDPQSDYLSVETLCIHALGQGGKLWGYHPALLPWLKVNLPRFDAVILNGLWQYKGFVLWKLRQIPGTPRYFVYPHGMLDPWFQREPKRRLKAIRNWYYWKLVEQNVIHNAEAVLFTCAEEMRIARNTFRPYQPKRQVNVGYGVAQPPPYHKDMAKAFAQACPGVKGKPYLLFLGRLHPKKGVHYLIEAYSALCRSCGGLALPKLVIAGPGLDSRYGRKMQTLASEACPPGCIFWSEMLAGNAKWGAFYNCEAFVLPSNQENFGIAAVEALACGRPVLISDQVNIWREIKEGGAALVEGNSVAGTTRLLTGWSNLSKEARSGMAARAIPSFQRLFTIEAATHKLLAVLASPGNTEKSPSEIGRMER